MGKVYQEHLLIVNDDKGKRSVPLLESTYSIGRDQSCDIRLSSQFVSRRHAVLNKRTNEDGSISYFIVDGDETGKPSANGLLINGQKQATKDLIDGDEVVFGPQVSIVYQTRQRSIPSSVQREEGKQQLDPFDITLIDPAMME